MGHWQWKPWTKSKKAHDPWGFALAGSDQLLDGDRIMAHKRSKTLEMLMTDIQGPHCHTQDLRFLGFTKWALPYVLLEDARQDVGN